MAKSQTKSALHFTASTSSPACNEFHLMGPGEYMQIKMDKEQLIALQGNTWFIFWFKICVLQPGSLLS